MISVEIRAKIQSYERQIYDYNTKINKLEDDESELDQLKAKFDSLQSDFENRQSKRKGALSGVPSVSKLNCATKYYEGMDALLTGFDGESKKRLPVFFLPWKKKSGTT